VNGKRTYGRGQLTKKGRGEKIFARRRGVRSVETTRGGQTGRDQRGALSGWVPAEVGQLMNYRNLAVRGGN